MGVKETDVKAMESATGGMDLTGGGTIYFAPNSGKVLKVSANFRMDGSVSMPPEAVKEGEPASIKFSMDMKMEMTKL